MIGGHAALETVTGAISPGDLGKNLSILDGRSGGCLVSGKSIVSPIIPLPELAALLYDSRAKKDSFTQRGKAQIVTFFKWRGGSYVPILLSCTP